MRIQLFHGASIVADAAAGAIRIGRVAGNDVVLPLAEVSRAHAELVIEPTVALIRDLGSSNGSRVRRGRSVTELTPGEPGVPVEDGDELELGPPGVGPTLSIRVVATPSAFEEAARRVASGYVGEAGGATILGVARVEDTHALEGRLEDDAEALRALYHLLRSLGGARDTEAACRAFDGAVREALPAATDVGLHLVADAGGDVDAGGPEAPPAVAGGAELSLEPWAGDAAGRAVQPLSRTLLERLVVHREAVLFNDLADLGGAQSLLAGGVRSGMAVPLWDEERIRGVVQVLCAARAGAFRQTDLELLALMGHQLAVVLRERAMTERLVRLNAELRGALERVEMLDRAKEHLKKFVPETVARRVDLSPLDPGLDPADADATVLFLDIGGYTKLTEALDRGQVSFLVETYFSAFIDDIYAHHGDINETAGDGLMIIFQADDPLAHCENAVRAALACRRRTGEINARSSGWDPIAVNFGISTGVVSIGSRRIQGLVGSRWTYTATGMVTNVSARIGAHATNGQILIGPLTAERVRDRFELRSLGPVPFKNVSRPLEVFEVLAER